MKKQIVITIVKYIFALHFIIFGANKFLLFASFPPPVDETAQLFMGGMFGTYLAKLVGIIEILGGILLILPKTTFIGFLMLLPISVNIIAYHLAHDFPGNGIWIVTLVLQIVLAYAFKDRLMQLLIVKPSSSS